MTPYAKKAPSLLAVILLLMVSQNANGWIFKKSARPSDDLPSFTLPLLEGNQQLASADMADKVVLINFWATWCGPCVAEFPDLARLHEDLSLHNFSVVAIAMDKRAEDVRNFLVKQRPPFPVVMGNRAVSRQFGAGSGLPVSFLVNRQGKVVRKYYGVRSYEFLKSDIELLLGPTKVKK